MFKGAFSKILFKSFSLEMVIKSNFIKWTTVETLNIETPQ